MDNCILGPMKPQIVSLETAKLAKEKGFDQHPYRAHSNQYDGYYPEFSNGTGRIMLLGPLYNLEHIIAIAPSQCSLQKWLREEHNIHILTRPFHDSLLGKTTCVADVIRIGDGRVLKSPRMDTYEQALEVALVNALNLIK